MMSLENEVQTYGKGKIITQFVFRIRNLLVISFIIKWYARVNIIRHIKKKYGKDIICGTREIEDLINKHTNIQLEIKFIKTCKRKDLIPTFAKMNVAIKHCTQISKVKIISTVIEVNVKQNMIKN